MTKILMGVICSTIITVSLPLAAATIPGFTIKETLKKRLTCDSTTCTQTQQGGIQAKYYNGPFTQSVIDGFDEQSLVYVNIGDYSFSGSLGSDPAYQAGDTKATLRNVVMTSGGSKVAATIKLSWKDGFIRMQVKTLAAYSGSAGAWSLLGSTPGPVQLEMDIYLQIVGAAGSINDNFQDVQLFGTLTRKTKIVDGTSYDLDSITVAGTKGVTP